MASIYLSPAPPREGGVPHATCRGLPPERLDLAEARSPLPFREGGGGVRFTLRLRQFLALLDGHLDRADVVEGLLGQVVVLAVQNLAEAAHRLLAGDVLAGQAREDLGDEEGLREEALHLPGARHGQLVVVRKLLDAEDG